VRALLCVILITFAAAARDTNPARLLEDTERMLDGMPVLMSLGESARMADGSPVVIYTTIGSSTKVVAPMPDDGVFPASVFRYRILSDGDWQWIQEIVYNTGDVRRMEVSR